MKILLVNDFIEKVGGAEKAMYDIKDLLEKNDHQVIVLGKKGNKYSFLSFFDRFFSIKYFIKTYRLIKSNNIDVVHIHNCSRNISPSPVVAGKLLGKKVIITVHDFHLYCPKTWGIQNDGTVCKIGFHNYCFLKNCITFKNGYKYILYNLFKQIKVGLHRFILKKYVDLFVCSSKKLQEMISKTLKLSNKKVIHLANFMELNTGYKLNFDNINEDKFLYVGRISKEKGIDVAIKAFDIIVNQNGIKDIYFDIIGDGDEINSINNLINKYGLQDNVKLLGKIDNNKLGSYYESAVSLIMPSVWLENNPLVAIEGMKYGKPIIGSDIGGYPDLIENGKNGFLFEVGNAFELSKYILKLYKNKELSKEMGNYGFQKLSREFGSIKFYDKLMKIYTDKF